MRKVLIGISSMFMIEADESCLASDISLKEAMENGKANVVMAKVTLVGPDGKQIDDNHGTEKVKQALIYGLTEKA